MMPFSTLFSPGRRSMEPLLGSDDSDVGGEKAQLYPQRASSPDGPRQTGYHAAMPPRKLLPLLGVIAFLAGLAFVLAKDQPQQPLRFLSSSRSSVKTAQNIRLKTIEEPYVAVRDPQRRYSWSSEAFMPAKGEDTRQHTVSIYPRQVKLDGLPDTVSPEEIVFGFTTPYKRAREMSTTWKHFLKHGSQCLIVLPREEEPYRREMEFYLAKEGLEHCRVATVDLGQYQRYEHRVLNMPRAMSEQRWTDRNGKEVKPKWFVVVDDDSQVLDMRTLQREMASRPNQEDHMLCAVTESVTQLGRHGKICYGGGGVVMSAGLVKKMTDKMFDCMWLHHWRFGGDEMLTHCAATATSSAPDKVFTDITGLHQVDIPGDGSGVFQSGLPFITLHHYTGWLEIFPLWHCPNRLKAMKRLQEAAYYLGGDNLFKRFVFDEGRTVLTLGYSITMYNKPLKEYEMRLMERTYRSWEHELRWPARPNVPEGKAKGRYKVTYYLKDIDTHTNTMTYENARGEVISVQLEF